MESATAVPPAAELMLIEPESTVELRPLVSVIAPPVCVLVPAFMVTFPPTALLLPTLMEIEPPDPPEARPDFSVRPPLSPPWRVHDKILSCEANKCVIQPAW